MNPTTESGEIRFERPDDLAAIRAINEAAFGGIKEADLVDRLRAAGKALLSLVAIHDGAIAGHILFSPVSLDPIDPPLVVVGLAPMAVHPELQNRGIGSRLVRAGLERCRSAGHDGVVVLGHPLYYPRFGFVPASRFGLRSEYDAPDDAFMALELRPGAFRSASGVVKYQQEFAAAAG